MPSPYIKLGIFPLAMFQSAENPPKAFVAAMQGAGLAARDCGKKNGPCLI